jgi:cellulose biosynthesis protein BcsQ
VKIISFVNFKGGAGKTSALSVVASALLARGHKVALFESDENAPLGAWRSNARTKGRLWDFPSRRPRALRRSAPGELHRPAKRVP